MISILIPVKNASLFLEECLNSILSQSYTSWELIAIDDHSDDDSHSILSKYARTDHRIHVFRNEGTGIINALRLAYKKSTGDFITRMDADDIMPALKLELLLEQVQSNDEASLAVGLVKYFSTTILGGGYKAYEEWLNQITSTKTNFQEIYKECSIPSPAWMLRRQDLDRCGAFDSDIYPEDYDLAFRMKAQGFKICPTKEVVHLWRDHPDRSSRTSDDYADNRFLRLKVHHFIKLDLVPEKKLILWGAGKKGKTVARLLIKRQINFDWITNNPNKISHNIGGKLLKSDTEVVLNVKRQFIIAVAQPENKEEIEQRLNSNQLSKGSDYFFFC